MKTILARYIARSTMLATLLVTLIISAVLFLILLLGELKAIGEGDYNLAQALAYVVLRLPNELYQFSPMLILLGGIIGLSLLSGTRELAIMRASGFSVRRIIVCVLASQFLLIVAMGLLGEMLAPHLSYKAEIRKEIAQNGGQAVVTNSGVWFHLDNNFIHVQRVVGRQLLEGVTRYQFDDAHRLQAAFYAKTLAFDDDAWRMHDVAKTTFYPERTESETFATLPWGLKFNPNLLRVGLVEPSEMSLAKLAQFSQYLVKNGLQARAYQYAFWRRLLQPLAALVMIFLAIPFVLSVMSVSTLGVRLLLGVMLGFIFFISNAFLGELCIVYQLPPLFAALTPIVGFALLGLLLANRMIRN